MDIQNYLKQQLNFIRQFYDMSSAPFIERKRLIEEGEEPFTPKYWGEEDSEPYFLDEELEADDSLQILGCVCVSMLSNLFKIYFKEWEDHRIGKVVDVKEFKNNGFLYGYKDYFAKKFDVHFENSPANLMVLEEIILVRNNFQHKQSIIVNTTAYSVADLKKLRPSPFFMDDYKAARFSEADEVDFEFIAFLEGSSVQITKEKLYTAISEMEKLTEWLESLWKERNQ